MLLLEEVASVVEDASELAKAGTIGVLSIGIVVACWVAWQMYKRQLVLQEKVEVLQSQRVTDAKEYAKNQQEHRDDAIGVATLAVEALQRQPQANEAMIGAMRELEDRDVETHRLIESTMKLVEDRSRR